MFDGKPYASEGIHYTWCLRGHIHNPSVLGAGYQISGFVASIWNHESENRPRRLGMVWQLIHGDDPFSCIVEGTPLRESQPTNNNSRRNESLPLVAAAR